MSDLSETQNKIAVDQHGDFKDERKRSKDLDYLMPKWINKLKLQYWNIEYEFCDRQKMEGKCHAKVSITLTKRDAAIIFILEDEFGKFNNDAVIKEEYNLEQSVVHELVHVFLAGLGCTGDDEEEATVNILSKILLEQDHSYQELNEKYDECIK